MLGENVELVTLALAPQTLVDCGEPVAQSVVETDENRFAGSLATTTVPDGSYCVIAVADEGRLSTVLGGITVANAVELGESLGNLQLPTRSLDASASAPATVAVTAAPSRFGALSALGSIVLAATAGLAVGVLALGLWARRRSNV